MAMKRAMSVFVWWLSQWVAFGVTVLVFVLLLRSRNQTILGLRRDLAKKGRHLHECALHLAVARRNGQALDPLLDGLVSEEILVCPVSATGTHEPHADRPVCKHCHFHLRR